MVVQWCPCSREDLGKATATTPVNAHSEANEFRGTGDLADETAYQAILAVENDVLLSVDLVIYASHWLRQAVEIRRGVQPRSSTVIWNGIAAVAPFPALTRAELQLESDDLVLINVGSIEPRKNQLGLIDLFAAISAKFPRARLLLVGDGQQRGEVQRKVDQLGLNKRVSLLGVRMDVPAILPVADIYIHYANLENCPIALLEAARAGIALAATPVGGIPEIQAQLESDIVLPVDDVAGSLQVLEPILSNAVLRAEYGQRARHNFQRYFTTEVMTSAFLRA